MTCMLTSELLVLCNVYISCCVRTMLTVLRRGRAGPRRSEDVGGGGGGGGGGALTAEGMYRAAYVARERV